MNVFTYMLATMRNCLGWHKIIQYECELAHIFPFSSVRTGVWYQIGGPIYVDKTRENTEAGIKAYNNECELAYLFSFSFVTGFACGAMKIKRGKMKEKDKPGRLTGNPKISDEHEHAHPPVPI